MSKKGTIGKILAGTAIGVGIGTLIAPKKGSEARKDIKEKVVGTVDKAKETFKKVCHKKEETD